MKIVLGVTGSIAAYKAIDITREWVKAGHQVKVVLTQGALEFVQIQTFKYIGALEVYGPQEYFHKELVNNDRQSPVLHIELAKWCDHLVVAPLSANTMANLAHGMAPDLLCAIYLATPTTTPITLYPAMNSLMLTHAATQSNMAILKKIKNILIHSSASGMLACGDEGQGKLPSVESITNLIPARNSLINKDITVLITAGATISPIDPVRYITNPSSGLTAFYLAQSLLAKGYQVNVIAGPNATPALQHLVELPNYRLEVVTTTEEMFLSVQHHFTQCDFYVSTAAIGDIRIEPQMHKLKKSDFPSALPITKSPDILQWTLAHRTVHQKIIGFAAETEQNSEIFLQKWQRKPTDLLIGNFVDNGYLSKDPVQGFGNIPGNRYFFIEKGTIHSERTLSKRELATAIEQWIQTETRSDLGPTVQLFTSTAEFLNWRKRQVAPKKIGLVPTMGNLHAGHISLVHQIAQQTSIVVISIFVNPKQFGPNEDFERYPRTLTQDLQLIEQAAQAHPHCQFVVLAPAAVTEIFPSDTATQIAVTGLENLHCGEFRPGHFAGVTTVVHRLFALVRPHQAIFGQKDYQQLAIIKRMTIDLLLDIEIVEGPIVRDQDGLALSSRNQYLDPSERQQALTLPRTLQELHRRLRRGESNITEWIHSLLTQDSGWQYLRVIDPQTLQNLSLPFSSPQQKYIVIGAYKVGRTRLIDNLSSESECMGIEYV